MDAFTFTLPRHSAWPSALFFAALPAALILFAAATQLIGDGTGEAVPVIAGRLLLAVALATPFIAVETVVRAGNRQAAAQITALTRALAGGPRITCADGTAEALLRGRTCMVDRAGHPTLIRVVSDRDGSACATEVTA